MTRTIYATEEQVDARIAELAHEITTDFSGKKPLFVALLRGAGPFASKRMFMVTKIAPEFHPELDYMMVSTYGSGREAGEPRIVADLSPKTVISRRPVIILDDVLDKGVTAHFVTAHLRSSGASDIRVAVLASKRTERLYAVTADYCGFEVDDAWLVGMGMDDAGSGVEHNRWLGSIEAIIQT